MCGKQFGETKGIRYGTSCSFSCQFDTVPLAHANQLSLP